MGRLGKDPELKYTPSGTAVCTFSVATSENWTDKSGKKQEKTEWHKIVVWGKLGELCNQYLAKGRQTFVEGRIQTRSWDDQDGAKRYVTEINANSVQFLGESNKVSKNNSQDGQGNSQQESYSATTETNYSAEDIPF